MTQSVGKRAFRAHLLVHTYWCTPTGAHLLVPTYLSRLLVYTYWRRNGRSPVRYH
jgi:hypothetical protein